MEKFRAVIEDGRRTGESPNSGFLKYPEVDREIFLGILAH
jgi:hypothetical protein